MSVICDEEATIQNWSNPKCYVGLSMCKICVFGVFLPPDDNLCVQPRTTLPLITMEIHTRHNQQYASKCPRYECPLKK